MWYFQYNTTDSDIDIQNKEYSTVIEGLQETLNFCISNKVVMLEMFTYKEENMVIILISNQ